MTITVLDPLALRVARRHWVTKEVVGSLGKSIVPLGESIVRVTAYRAAPEKCGAVLGKSIVPNDRLAGRLYAKRPRTIDSPDASRNTESVSRLSLGTTIDVPAGTIDLPSGTIDLPSAASSTCSAPSGKGKAVVGSPVLDADAEAYHAPGPAGRDRVITPV